MSKRLVLYFAIGLAVLVPAGLVGACLIYGVVVSSRNNAKCPICGREFRIPEEHRGTIAEDLKDYSCPNCGFRSSPRMLYEAKDGVKKGAAP